MLLPLNSEGNTQMHGKTKHFEAFNAICTGWKCDKTTVAHPSPETLTVTVTGTYAEATGSYQWIFSAAHPPQLAYEFTMRKKLNPRQVGVVFDLPKGLNQLTWERTGQWTTYPTDHIGRLTGTASAKSPHALEATEIGPRTQPGENQPWSSDHTRYGANDFRSTKENITHARISTGPDGPGLTLLPADTKSPLHLRAWIDPATGTTRMLAASYTNGGAERFLRRLSKADDKPMQKGTVIQSAFQFTLE
jgi:hypothetical protein